MQHNFQVNTVFILQNERNSISVNDASMRTTSSLESMNSALRRLSSAHPSTFRFVDCIRYHEFSKSLDLADVLKFGYTPTYNRSEVENLDKKIKRLTLALKEDPEMDAGVFLKNLSNGMSITDL